MVGASDLLNQVWRRTLARFSGARAAPARRRPGDEPERPRGVTTFDFLDDLVKPPEGDASSAISSDRGM